MKQGTEWTEPGKGATVRQIEAALVDYESRCSDGVSTRKAWINLGAKPLDHVTDLVLVGLIQIEDMRRIAECK